MVVKANKITGFVKYWLPVIIYAILIFQVSAVPGEQLPRLFNYQDIFFHVVEYMFFAILLVRALKAYNQQWPPLKLFLCMFAIAFLYAAIDEFHQLFTAGRVFSISDLGCDGLGILISRIVYR